MALSEWLARVRLTGGPVRRSLRFVARFVALCRRFGFAALLRHIDRQTGALCGAVSALRGGRFADRRTGALCGAVARLAALFGVANRRGLVGFPLVSALSRANYAQLC